MFIFRILLKNYSIFDIGLQKFFLLSGFQIEIWFRFGLHLFFQVQLRQCLINKKIPR